MGKMKRLMILGGSENQLPLILRAKQRGYYVAVCDMDRDCIGFSFADKKIPVSIKDRAALLDAAKKECMDGITTNSEQVLHIASALAAELGLPCVPYDVTERFRNKYLMRDWLTQYGLSDVPYCLCGSKEDALAFFRKNRRKKCIMKPLDNSASRGVYSVLGEKDINLHFYGVQGLNRTHSGVLLESYVEGKEFTVDGICIDGKHTTLAISKKKHFKYNENIANELYFSYEDSDFNYDEIRRMNDSIVECAGLNFGLTHAEYKYDGKFHLIEVAARGGGAYISTDIVPFLTKTDTVGVFLECVCGGYKEGRLTVPDDSKQRTAVLKFFSTPGDKGGVVKEIFGKGYLEKSPYVLRYGLEFDVGDYIRPASNDGERIGYYIAVAEDMDELNTVMEDIENNFGIVFV